MRQGRRNHPSHQWKTVKGRGSGKSGLMVRQAHHEIKEDIALSLSKGNTKSELPFYRVIGIDPGSLYCGYGIIERKSNNSYIYITSGNIEISRYKTLDRRIMEIYDALQAIIKTYRPNVAAIEKVFFAKGVKSALSLGHVRGVSLLAAVKEGLTIYEYSPLEVKKAVVGYGRAEKSQVQAMVKSILNVDKDLSYDSADALAVSICHLNTIRFEELIKVVS